MKTVLTYVWLPLLVAIVAGYFWFNPVELSPRLPFFVFLFVMVCALVFLLSMAGRSICELFSDKEHL